MVPTDQMALISGGISERDHRIRSEAHHEG
jgi:hypothetical protein